VSPALKERQAGWPRLAALVYVAALVVITLLPTRWPPGASWRRADYEPKLVPFDWWQVLGVGAGVSLAIELYQLAWPGVRKASVNDVLMNALGALLGFAALRLTGHHRGDSSRRT
jgi:glycopeptide antibiotics resistance protein